MAEGDDGADDRTEAPSQRRIDRARDEGNVPMSREALAFATLLAATIAGVLALPALSASWLRALRTLLETSDPAAGLVAGRQLVEVTGLGILPILAAVTVAGVLASL